MARTKKKNGGGSNKRKRSGGDGGSSNNNKGLYGPFNVMPMTRKAQSKQDKKKHEQSVAAAAGGKASKRSATVLKQNAKSIVTSSKKLSKSKKRILAKKKQKEAPSSLGHAKSSSKLPVRRTKPVVAKHKLLATKYKTSGGGGGGRVAKKTAKKRKRSTSINDRVRAHAAAEKKEPSSPSSKTKPRHRRTKPNNKHNKKSKFVYRLPGADECDVSRCEVPWWCRDNDSDGDSDDVDGGGDGGIVPESILSQLDDEIESFGRYVRLSRTEREARRHFVEHVSNLAADLYGRPTHRGSNDRTKEAVRVVPFGSYATQEVCTFASDVDLAVWGAVRAPVHTGFICSEEEEEDCDGNDGDAAADDDDDDDDPSERGSTEDLPKLSESAMINAMEALRRDQEKLSGRRRRRRSGRDGGSENGRVVGSAVNVDVNVGVDEIAAKKEERVRKWREVLDAASGKQSGQEEEDEESETGGAMTKEHAASELNEKFPSSSATTAVAAATACGILEGDSAQPMADGERVGDGLFEIDRIGEKSIGDDAAPGETPMCAAATNIPPQECVEEKACDATGNGGDSDDKVDNEPTCHRLDDFRFVIDREGAKELGHNEEGGRDEDSDVKHHSDSTEHVGRDAKEQEECDPACTSEALEEGVGAVPVVGGSQSLAHGSQDSSEKDAVENCSEGSAVPSGKSATDPIEIGDDTPMARASVGNSEVELICINDSESDKEPLMLVDSTDSDKDSADKMEAFHSNIKTRPRSKDVSEQKRYSVNLSSSTSESDTGDDSDSDSSENDLVGSCAVRCDEDYDFEVSWVASPREIEADARKTTRQRPFLQVGPSGSTRKLVVSALNSLGRKLWKSSLTHTVEVRRHARVPIISMNTRLGFDGDIALGGHNGADTSKYAQLQVQRHRSFASVVLLLKILLQQNDLDKPFTGGLGSYKLYVLVAHHLDRHMALGGKDRPSEALLSFLLRYGRGKNGQVVDRRAVTELSQDTTLSSDGGVADLQPVFKIEHCAELFAICRHRLCQQLKHARKHASFLGSIIDAARLRRERELCRNKSTLVSKYKSASLAEKPISRDHGGKVTACQKRVGYVFSKTAVLAGSASKRRKSMQRYETIDSDQEADQLMAGYGMERGQRGGLIPRSRPDLEAKRAEQNDPLAQLLGRARKNRKNKKKQSRDTALLEFARREL